MVLHCTISTGFRRRNPANRNSSIPSGSGAVAAYGSTGSPPSATATGMRDWPSSL